jgi:hypothetical protein
MRVHATHSTSPLRTALFDPFAFNNSQYATGYAMTRAAGATYVRIAVSWSEIAPKTPPAGFVGSDPDSTGYSWTWLDSTVQAAVAAGLTPMLQIGSQPGWASVTSRKGTRISTPKIAPLRDFAHAVATRYDGNRGEPRVSIFQVWNEPNLSLDLSPVKASVYRTMVNAVAASVHAVSRSNLVVAGGLDPFGNKGKTWYAVPPLAYMRSLLCVSMGNPKAKKRALRKPHATCRAKVHLDIWSHHPYTFNGPFGHAKRRDDVSLGDLPKMRSLLRAALKLHRISSTHGVQFWVTEFSWDTKPPRRHAAPVGLAARWTAEALYQMWRSGVSLVTWFGLEDKGGKSPYQSGLYFHAKSLAQARAKPVRTAFRFPFVAYLGRGGVDVWGRDATSTKELVTVQRRSGTRGHWRTVARIRSNAAGIFRAKIKLAAAQRDWLRAVAPGSGNSLAFSLTRPSPKLRYGPWGN